MNSLSLVGVAPAMLRAGLGKSLPLISSMWLADDGERAEEVAERVEVVDLLRNGQFGMWEIRWRRPGDKGPSIKLTRTADLADIGMEKRELMQVAEKERAVKALKAAVEIVSFDIQNSDGVESMAWPVALSAAAWLATTGRGILHAKGEGWFQPAGNDLRRLD